MTTARRPFVLLTAVALAAGAASCFKEDAPAPAAKTATSPVPAVSGPKPNLVLITMEATRADHLGCYDDPQAETPALDRLAREGAIFARAIAIAPLTRPSHASIFTGLYPSRHGVRDDDGSGLREAETTLAEHLRSQGYATAAAVGARILAGDAGLEQGFDSYAGPKRGSRAAPLVIDDAIEAINRIQGGPFFLWVQLNDPHAPYAPPPGLRARYERRPYDGELASVDTQLERLFGHLRAAGLFDDTVVVATADHGESLGEHGEETHGLFLYDSTLKVPLLVRYPPRIAAGTKFEGLVSGVDVAPTLLDLMGLPAMATVQGESCAARLLGGDGPEREVVYAESLFGERLYGWAPLHALRSSQQKFVDAPEPELYDVRRDPAETINLAARDRRAVQETWLPALDEALRAMGDVASGTGTSGDAPSRRDPKALVRASNLFLRAQSAVEEGHPEQAVPLLRQALAKDPGNPAATSLLAALVVKPNAAAAHYALGNDLAAQGDAAGAERELRAAVAADPKLADGWNKLGIVLDKVNRRPEALAAFSRALEASPDHPDALFNRAKLELLEGNVRDARRDLDRLLAAHGDYAAGRYLEANVCVAENNPVGAKAALNAFLALPQIDPRMKAAAEKLLQQLGG